MAMLLHLQIIFPVTVIANKATY